MSKKVKSAGINAALEKAIEVELKEVLKKGDDGKPVYGLLDRMRVYNTALKLEAIKLKADDPMFGTGFTDTEE